MNLSTMQNPLLASSLLGYGCPTQTFSQRPSKWMLRITHALCSWPQDTATWSLTAPSACTDHLLVHYLSRHAWRLLSPVLDLIPGHIIGMTHYAHGMLSCDSILCYLSIVFLSYCSPSLLFFTLLLLSFYCSFHMAGSFFIVLYHMLQVLLFSLPFASFPFIDLYPCINNHAFFCITLTWILLVTTLQRTQGKT